MVVVWYHHPFAAHSCYSANRSRWWYGNRSIASSNVYRSLYFSLRCVIPHAKAAKPSVLVTSWYRRTRLASKEAAHSSQRTTKMTALTAATLETTMRLRLSITWWTVPRRDAGQGIAERTPRRRMHSSIAKRRAKRVGWHVVQRGRQREKYSTREE